MTALMFTLLSQVTRPSIEVTKSVEATLNAAFAQGISSRKNYSNVGNEKFSVALNVSKHATGSSQMPARRCSPVSNSRLSFFICVRNVARVCFLQNMLNFVYVSPHCSQKYELT